MVVVYTEPVYTKYTASRWSKAYIFFWICVATIILLPYLLTWWSHSMWKKTETYREQPQIQFTKRLVLLLEGSTLGSPLIFSTVPEVNEIVGSAFVRAPEIRTREIDEDLDGIADYMNMTIEMPLYTGETVQRAHLALFFNVQLQDRIRLEMDALAYIREESALSGAELTVFGDLTLHQRNPLYVNHDRTTYANNILDASTIKSIKDVTFPTLLGNSYLRNETIRIDNYHTFWTSGSRPSFRITLHTRYPHQTITYKPEAWEVLKFAWVQYLSVLLIIYFLVDLIQSFVFRYQILDTHVVRALDASTKYHQS